MKNVLPIEYLTRYYDNHNLENIMTKVNEVMTDVIKETNEDLKMTIELDQLDHTEADIKRLRYQNKRNIHNNYYFELRTVMKANWVNLPYAEHHCHMGQFLALYNIKIIHSERKYISFIEIRDKLAEKFSDKTSMIFYYDDSVLFHKDIERSIVERIKKNFTTPAFELQSLNIRAKRKIEDTEFYIFTAKILEPNSPSNNTINIHFLTPACRMDDHEQILKRMNEFSVEIDYNDRFCDEILNEVYYVVDGINLESDKPEDDGGITREYVFDVCLRKLKLQINEFGGEF